MRISSWCGYHFFSFKISFWRDEGEWACSADVAASIPRSFDELVIVVNGHRKTWIEHKALARFFSFFLTLELNMQTINYAIVDTARDSQRKRNTDSLHCSHAFGHNILQHISSMPAKANRCERILVLNLLEVLRNNMQVCIISVIIFV